MNKLSYKALIEVYHQAKELQLSEEFITLVLNEIEIRKMKNESGQSVH
ncbi:sporulation histidine kinase inhibitor Sda [Evansella sp. AB-P1]|nr:sporulation histidine kinase inhibitor Sda [Evansella sp. AB-P1]MDG5789108.1 sporulation histidine kinase inhibitor Sda [Evansella sp. AB-P1]